MGYPAWVFQSSILRELAGNGRPITEQLVYSKAAYSFALAQDTESVTVVCRVDFRKPCPCEQARIVKMLLNNKYENAASCLVHYLSVAYASGS